MEFRHRRGENDEKASSLTKFSNGNSTEPDDQNTQHQHKEERDSDAITSTTEKYLLTDSSQLSSDAKLSTLTKSSTLSSFKKSSKRRSNLSKAGYGILCNAIAGLLILYVAIPIWFYSCPWLRQHIVFLTVLTIPPFLNLSNPDSFELYCPRNFYVESEPGLKLGAWYIPSINEPCDKNAPLTFAGHDPVVLYLHGNAGSRGGTHRVGLYKLLTSQAKVHVVAIDYRGYGDSSTIKMPTVAGLVHDAMAAYRKIRETVPNKRIIVWGHSLGTGVSTYLMANLTELKDLPAGLVLESPFDMLANAVKHNPMARLHRFMPFFEKVFVDSLNNHPATNFNSLEKSKLISPKLPIVILEAKDDLVIPFELSETLYQSFLEVRQGRPDKGPIDFVTFAREYGYGHKYIYTHPGLAQKMRIFFDEATSSTIDLNS
ncbi:monoacylglycerol lipase ABHD12-like [Varroa jacobsoni]|uniref:AB hydrolase-1 domain-containing protein n=1 Tax=Varroa destructor TaxID=109461 RepID=A0A7M7JV20_VARDE|nr:monoacylglycerol lipase ABHD12-like [Varroa destructor]XP_022705033.1 monoacylglycerol lipase ABHD12-like [Varroa jacobsoni]